MTPNLLNRFKNKIAAIAFAVGSATVVLAPTIALQPNAAADNRPSDQKPISTDELGPLFEELRIYSRPALRRVIAKELSEALKGPDIPSGDDGKVTEIPEHQILRIIATFPSLRKMLKEYAILFPKIDDNDAEQKKARKEFAKKLTEMLAQNDLKERLIRFLSIADPVILSDAGSELGYRHTQFAANHPTIREGKTVPASNLKEMLIRFIQGAKKELVFNVFDFDLQEVADALVERAKAGVKIRGGIDSGVIDTRPEVKKIFKYLKSNGIEIYSVDSVKLNHQKIWSRDYTTRNAEVLFSSGNATQSCIGPEGDLTRVSGDERPKDSLPNANHMVQMQSQAIALLVNHELTKTLDMGLRGAQYPLGGVYKLFGEIETPSQKTNPSVTIAFTPKGGLGDLNRDVIAKYISLSSGAIDFVQFAFSSQIVEQALFKKMQEFHAAGKPFDLKLVGDLNFSRQYWAVPLSIIGMKAVEIKKGDVSIKAYVEDEASPWVQILSKEEMTRLRQGIHAPPPAYGKHTYRPPDGGEPVEYEVKIHHKIMVTPEIAILGTSFNFSAGAADGNNEQLALFEDPEMVLNGQSILEYLFQNSQGTLYQTVLDTGFKRWKAAFGRGLKPQEAKAAYEKALAKALKDSCNDALKPAKKEPVDGEAQISIRPLNRIFAGPVISTASP